MDYWGNEDSVAVFRMCPQILQIVNPSGVVTSKTSPGLARFDGISVTWSQLSHPALDTGYLIRIAGSPNRIHVRRTSLSVIADFALDAASPTVTGVVPNSSR